MPKSFLCRIQRAPFRQALPEVHFVSGSLENFTQPQPRTVEGFLQMPEVLGNHLGIQAQEPQVVDVDAPEPALAAVLLDRCAAVLWCCAAVLYKVSRNSRGNPKDSLANPKEF